VPSPPPQSASGGGCSAVDGNLLLGGASWDGRHGSLAQLAFDEARGASIVRSSERSTRLDGPIHALVRGCVPPGASLTLSMAVKIAVPPGQSSGCTLGQTKRCVNCWRESVAADGTRKSHRCGWQTGKLAGAWTTISNTFSAKDDETGEGVASWSIFLNGPEPHNDILFADVRLSLAT